MTTNVTKAVFPVAGLGSRFLPATKAVPKELLPIVDKPLIQYAVEEAVEAGARDLVFVTSRTKRAIEDHFDTSVELEKELEERGKTELLAIARDVVPAGVNCVYVRQSEPLGLGHAVLCAKPVIGNEPFSVILPDDLIDNDTGAGCVKQMVDAFSEYGCSLLAVQSVPAHDTDKYGVVDTPDTRKKVCPVEGLVEKPKPDEAPSNLAVVGRYVLTPAVMDELENTGRGAGNEIQLTDAIAAVIGKESVKAYRFDGKRYDCGSKAGFLEATVELGLKHPDIADAFGGSLNALKERGAF